METGQELSLVAKFDDICRNYVKFLNSSDAEFLKFAVNQEECRQKWLMAENECVRLQAELKNCNQFVSQLESKVRHMSSLLMHEIKLRHQLQLDNTQMEKQLIMVREIVSSEKGIREETREKLVKLGSTESLNRHYQDAYPNMDLVPSEALNQRSEDELELSEIRSVRSGRTKRPTEEHEISSEEEQAKRHRPICEKGAVCGDRGAAQAQGAPIHQTTPKAIRYRDKPPRPLPPAVQLPAGVASSWRPEIPLFTYARQVDQKGTEAVQPTGGDLIPTQSLHRFSRKTIIKPETCLPCGNRVKFGRSALKCSDCRATCHLDCKFAMPLPCVPFVAPPTSPDADFQGVIGDFAPRKSPMIPALVIHCVNQIENRGMDTVGLYAVGGSERKVQELKECLLRDKWHPLILDMDIHLIASTLKHFLRGLKEPIINRDARDLFVAIVPLCDQRDVQSAVYSLVPQLAQPNRDTLAFLMVHLQRVAQSEGCKMTTARLAHIFGPILLGRDPDAETDDTSAKVVEKLMAIAANYWNRFIDVEVGIDCPVAANTFFPNPSLE